MKSAVAVLCLLACLGTAGAVASKSPVERVVNLLKDLKTKLTLDEKSEQQVYDKYACWCEKTTTRKAENIEKMTDEMRVLGQTILKLKGKIATLAAEIQELEEEIRANLKAQADATALRQKENAEYMAMTDETKQALTALQQAISVLVNATAPGKETRDAYTPPAAALLQQHVQSATALKRVIDALPSSGSLKADQMALLSEFMQGKDASKYMPQSFTVQGILKDMYETFATDLEKATGDEATANRNFEDFIHVKTVELKDARATKKEKEEEKAEAEVRLADVQQIYDDTMEQKMADIKFFDATKEACEAKHEGWTTRSSLREEEIAGIEKAISILSADDARDLFGSTIKEGKEVGAKDSYKTGMDISPSFLQLNGGEASPSMKAYAMLKAQATKSHSLRLAALAVSVRTAKVGHFDEVLKAIDQMIQTLKDEDTADIAKRDQCKDEYQKIASKIGDVTWLIQKNEAKIDKLEAIIATREEELAVTQGEIVTVTTQMEDMTGQRTSENQEFLAGKAGDQEAIRLLMEARDALSHYYKANEIEMGPIQGSVKGVFAQQGPEFDVSEDQAPEAEFSDKGKRKDEAKSIVQILTMIIEDLNDEIKNSMKAEEETQLEYEKLMAAAQKLKDELMAKELALTGAIAKRRQKKSDEETDLGNNQLALKDEQDYKASIKPDCDWIVGAFEKRATARASEMQGLVNAKEFLAGYNSADASLLEKKKGFNDATLSGLKFLGMRA